MRTKLPALLLLLTMCSTNAIGCTAEPEPEPVALEQNEEAIVGALLITGGFVVLLGAMSSVEAAVFAAAIAGIVCNAVPECRETFIELGTDLMLALQRTLQNGVRTSRENWALLSVEVRQAALRFENYLYSQNISVAQVRDMLLGVLAATIKLPDGRVIDSDVDDLDAIYEEVLAAIQQLQQQYEECLTEAQGYWLDCQDLMIELERWKLIKEWLHWQGVKVASEMDRAHSDTILLLDPQN